MMKKPYNNAFENPLLPFVFSDSFVPKKLTVSGIKGKTQGVKSAANPDPKARSINVHKSLMISL